MFKIKGGEKYKFEIGDVVDIVSGNSIATTGDLLMN